MNRRNCEICPVLKWGFPGDSAGKSACSAGEPCSSPGLGRSPGEGNGYPPQYSYLENSLARGAWWGTIHGVAKTWTQLSHQHFHIKDELFVVNSGDSGMGQGKTLSWRRGSLCPGWLQECPPALCAHPSCLRSSCPTEPAPTQSVSG